MFYAGILSNLFTLIAKGVQKIAYLIFWSCPAQCGTFW